MECMVDTFGATARIINRDVRQASLYLLKEIEVTVDALVRAQDTMSDFIVVISSTTLSIKECAKEETIDSEDAICELLKKSEDVLYDSFAVLDAKIEAAKLDHDLQDHNEEVIVDEYSRLISRCETLHESLIEMRWAIMEHDASVESELSETFDNVDDLMTSLKA